MSTAANTGPEPAWQLVVRNVTFDCADPYELARFWSAATGYPMYDDDHPGDPAAGVVPPDPRLPGLLFVRVPEGKATKNRVHLDVMPAGRTRDEGVARLLELGAKVLDDRRRPDGSGWVVMTDPEGNEFCVERSAAERAADPAAT